MDDWHQFGLQASKMCQLCVRNINDVYIALCSPPAAVSDQTKGLQSERVQKKEGGRKSNLKQALKALDHC